MICSLIDRKQNKESINDTRANVTATGTTEQQATTPQLPNGSLQNKVFY